MKLAKILSSPDRCGQGHFGVDAKGKLDSGPNAVRYCFNGALNLLLNERFYYGTGHYWTEEERERALEIFDAITDTGAGLGMLSWNDAADRTFEEVHAVAVEWDRLWGLGPDWRCGLGDPMFSSPKRSFLRRIIAQVRGRNL